MLKVMEKEHTILSMQKQIEELKRKAEQGSQQLQGEVLELQLEALLTTKFPHDTIEPVPKGEHGGDVLHHVAGPSGQSCGTMLWESKRTKNWSDGWLSKLRDDQRKGGPRHHCQHDVTERSRDIRPHRRHLDSPSPGRHPCRHRAIRWPVSLTSKPPDCTSASIAISIFNYSDDTRQKQNCLSLFFACSRSRAWMRTVVWS